MRAEALRLFPEVVRELGGDPQVLLAQVHIDPPTLAEGDTLISYRAMIQLLELTAEDLGCPDFGLRLAARQGGIAVLGPLAVAMRNCGTRSVRPTATVLDTSRSTARRCASESSRTSSAGATTCASRSC